MGFTPVNGNKPSGINARSGNGVVVKKTFKMLDKIPNPRPLHVINVSQIQPQQANPFAYAQQRGRANPVLDASFLKRPVRLPPSPPREHVDNLQEVPTLYPTAAEFADPDLYLSSLHEFEKYGMVKLVPPENWYPSLALDTKLFTFRSRHQLINKTVSEAELRSEFNDALKFFHEQSSKRSASFKVPLINKRPLNMYLLHRSVQLRGGLNQVSRKKMWQQIGRELGYSGKTMTSLSTSLRNCYQKWLAPFDEYLHKNGVNLSSSPRIVRYKILPDAVAKDGEIKLPIGILITMDCPPPDWTPERRPEISNSRTLRVVRSPPPQWIYGKYSPLNGAEQDASYNLKQFQTKAASFQDTYFRTEVTEADIEKEYWRLLKSPGECLDVEYGYSMTSASGFSHEWKDPWNFDLISMTDGSYLRYIDNHFMSHPRLDVGMLFASKAWASEPYFGSKLSISHFGATRTWYSVPPEFFETMSKVVDIRDNEYMATPEQLAKKNIPCYVTDQHPGEIIVVFPKSWHSHFNHGFNLNESVNFLPHDWLETGKLALKCYRDLKLPAPFSLDELICVAARSDNCDLLIHITKELEQMYKREKSFLEKFTDRSQEPFQQKVCIETNQTMAISWVDTPDGPVDPNYAKEGQIHTVYSDIDEYFRSMLDPALKKLNQSAEYINRVCRIFSQTERLSKETLNSLVESGVDTTKAKVVRAGLVYQISESDRLAAKAQYHGKPLLEWVDQMMHEYNQIICSVPEMEHLKDISKEHSKFLADIKALGEGNSKETIDSLLARGNDLPTVSPVLDVLVQLRNKITWANQVGEMLSSQPVVFLAQITGLLNEAIQIGIPPQSAFYQYLEDKKKAGVGLTSWGERVAYWGKIDPKELDDVLEEAANTPIEEQVYIRLQLFKSVHAVITSMAETDVAKRPRMSEASKYRVINAQVGEAVGECEAWLASFMHPDQLLLQIEAAAANGPVYMLMQVHLQSILQMLPKLDFLQVVPDNFEAWVRARQLLVNLVNAQEQERLQRYGFI